MLAVLLTRIYKEKILRAKYIVEQELFILRIVGLLVMTHRQREQATILICGAKIHLFLRL